MDINVYRGHGQTEFGKSIDIVGKQQVGTHYTTAYCTTKMVAMWSIQTLCVLSKFGIHTQQAIAATVGLWQCLSTTFSCINRGAWGDRYLFVVT